MFEMRTETLVGLHVNFRYCFPISVRRVIYRQIVLIFPSIRFHEATLKGSRVVTRGWTEKYGETNNKSHILATFLCEPTRIDLQLII